MSDATKDSAATGAAPQFTARELELLGWAMQSLKSGPPEVDYEKLAKFAGMGNPRSASNAWAKIKTKLVTPAPAGDGDEAPAAVKTSKKPATPRKRAPKKEAEDGDEGGDDTPKKATPRKRAAKKETVDGETATPKKKARATKSKKASDDEDTKVKAEAEAEESVEDELVPANGDSADAHMEEAEE
ncbi:hypothetical protein BDV95DRAFT_596463 [Massariosphaeria phaeospora]|uniref:Uncharacterized protein n=1 Tax=Massariosphaeria phaeospora TaxID=100035 RepID=A0A7C8M6Y2_9PLEO|nr:hypothetical protein BDV95DRAFT_596463 [Massariosphaeria phaeospora]